MALSRPFFSPLCRERVGVGVAAEERSANDDLAQTHARHGPGRRLDRAYRISFRWPVIKSFADKRAAAVFAGHAVRGLPMRIQRRARARLLAVDAAGRLDDLRAPPGNRLGVLRGDRRGRRSIRVDEQWRIRFVWRDGDAWEVEIVDCH